MQNITLKTMLNDLNLGINLISQLSKGSNITAINLAKIADYLGCSVDSLLGRDVDEQEKSSGTEEFMSEDEQEQELIRLARQAAPAQREIALRVLKLAVENEHSTNEKN